MRPSSALFFVFVVSFICLSGCGLQRPLTDPSQDKTAWQSAQILKSMNRNILTSKGTGKVRLKSSAGVQIFQIAWAAKAPDRLRITFTMSGYPVETIIADGDRVTFLSHTGRHKPHTPASNDPDLEPYTQVPLKLTDLICLLLGQIPVRQFDDAWFPPKDRSRIRVRKNFASSLQELVLAPDQPIFMLRLLDRNDTIKYEIHYHAFDIMDNRQIPVDLTITDGKSRSAHITITRFWPDMPVKESVFQLTQTGS
ncbi:MAG: hypothetical protein K9K21_08300 [Desulfotignum sp.]|nr:hypothetical protein [Desulfotignum sp.]